MLLLLPWLGETWFNSKGEPREAIVAVTMLQSGDWVLPLSFGSDMPYNCLGCPRKGRNPWCRLKARGAWPACRQSGL